MPLFVDGIMIISSYMHHITIQLLKLPVLYVICSAKTLHVCVFYTCSQKHC